VLKCFTARAKGAHEYVADELRTIDTYFNLSEAFLVRARMYGQPDEVFVPYCKPADFEAYAWH
jgi:hypothetical protein